MKSIFLQLSLLSLCFASSAILPASSLADTTKIEVEGSDALTKSLVTLTSKTVSLRLRSGDEISGVVEAVGPTAVRLGGIVGREYFSAIVKVEDISAVIYRSKDK